MVEAVPNHGPGHNAAGAAAKGLDEPGQPLLKEIAALGVTVTQLSPAERDAFVDNLLHPNGAEGIDAFFEKREPRYR